MCDKTFVGLKFKKIGKDRTYARVYVLASVTVNGGRKEAEKSLNEVVREMCGCEKDCACKIRR